MCQVRVRRVRWGWVRSMGVCGMWDVGRNMGDSRRAGPRGCNDSCEQVHGPHEQVHPHAIMRAQQGSSPLK